MSAWFVVSIIARRNDVADVAWGLGFVVMAWASFLLAGDAGLRGLIVTLLVSIWGIRLARHVYARNRGKPEDYRYHTWRETWGAWFYPRSFVQIYLLQGALLYLIAVPVTHHQSVSRYRHQSARYHRHRRVVHRLLLRVGRRRAARAVHC